MEVSNKENENIDLLHKESAKAVKICELILDNINLEQIKDSQVETGE